RVEPVSIWIAVGVGVDAGRLCTCGIECLAYSPDPNCIEPVVLILTQRGVTSDPTRSVQCDVRARDTGVVVPARRIVRQIRIRVMGRLNDSHLPGVKDGF